MHMNISTKHGWYSGNGTTNVDMKQDHSSHKSMYCMYYWLNYFVMISLELRMIWSNQSTCIKILNRYHVINFNLQCGFIYFDFVSFMSICLWPWLTYKSNHMKIHFLCIRIIILSLSCAMTYDNDQHHYHQSMISKQMYVQSWLLEYSGMRHNERETSKNKLNWKQ